MEAWKMKTTARVVDQISLFSFFLASPEPCIGWVVFSSKQLGYSFPGVF